MKVLTYIWHDCFVWENEKMALIFDYWTVPSDHNEEFPDFIKTIGKEKKIYVFVSHHHKDHFNKKVFSWEKFFPSIKFIISKDTFKHCRHMIRPDSLYTGYKVKDDNVIVLKPGETFHDNEILVEAFDSTDIGNSYIIKIEEEVIFHAGDLNAWIWKDESTDEEVREATSHFEGIIDKIATKYPVIDIAMFPVDARIGTDYYLGAKIFVRKINVARFFPMHFVLGENEEQRKKFEKSACEIKNYANLNRGEYICLITPYSSYGYS